MQLTGDDEETCIINCDAPDLKTTCLSLTACMCYAMAGAIPPFAAVKSKLSAELEAHRRRIQELEAKSAAQQIPETLKHTSRPRRKPMTQFAMALITIAHLAVQLGTLSNCCATAAGDCRGRERRRDIG